MSQKMKDSLSEYWESLDTPLRRIFLIVGLIVTSPILVVIIVIAGIAEAWKLTQNLEV